MIKTILIKHSELSVIIQSQGSNRRVREKGRESAISTGITCHYCKKPGHKVRDFEKINCK